ncbi:MAG: autotransporter domain-containing protein [Pseudomonadota bacterium]
MVAKTGTRGRAVWLPFISLLLWGTAPALWASAPCTVTGSGTVTSPAADDEIDCAGNASNLDIIVSNPNVVITLGQSANLSNSNVSFFGANNGTFVMESGAQLAAASSTVRALLITDTTVDIASGATITGDLHGIASSSSEAAIVTIGGTVSGSAEAVLLGGGDDVLNLTDGANLIGTGVSGGGGNDRLNLTGDGTLALTVQNFELLSKQGSGTWTLGDTVSSGTAIEVDAGVLRDASNAAILLGGNTVTLAQDALLDFNIAASSVLGFDAALRGDGGIVKSGIGTLRINGSSVAERDFAGDVSILAGTLEVNDSSLFDNATSVDTGATLALIAGGMHTGDITGAGQVRVTSPLSLRGDNTFTGGLEVLGSLDVVATDSLGSGRIDLGGNARLTIDNDTDQTLANALSRLSAGTIRLIKEGSGNLSVGSRNTNFDGQIEINDGRLTLLSSGSLGTGAINNFGEFSIRGNVANPISGSGSVIKEQGNNTASLLATNTYSGGTIINEGAIIGDIDSFGSGTITLNNAGVLVLSPAADGVFSNAVVSTGNNSFSKLGSFDLTLAAATNFGSSTVNGGRLIVNPELYEAAVTTVQSNGELEVNGAGVIDGVVRGNGGLLKTGNNRARIGRVNQLLGTIDVLAGTLVLGSGAGTDINIATGAALEFDGSTSHANDIVGGGGLVIAAGEVTLSGAIQHGGGSDILGGNVTTTGALGSAGVAIDAAGAWTLNTAADQMLTNAITGMGLLRKIGAGTLTVDGANDFGGSVHLDAGALEIGDAAALGVATIELGADTTLLLNDANLNNDLSGVGLLRKIGTDAVSLGGNNTHSGGVHIAGGELVAGLTSLGSGAITIDENTRLRISAADGELSNALAGAGALLVDSGQNVVFTGANDLAAMQVSGTATVDADSAAQSHTLHDGGALIWDDATEVSGVALSGSTGSRFIKAGQGALQLTTDTTLGDVVVEAGSLGVDAVLNVTGSDGLTVAADAALNGVGRIVGDVVLDGALRPGNSIGTLTIDGDYTQNAGSVLEIEYDNLGGIDLLDVTGIARIDGGSVNLLPAMGADGTGLTFLQAAGGVTGTFDQVVVNGAGSGSVIYDSSSASLGQDVGLAVVTARPSTLNSQLAAATHGAVSMLDVLVPDASPQDGRVVWGHVVAADGERDRNGDSLGYDYDSSGVGVGISLPIGEHGFVGIAASDVDGEASLDQGAGSTDIDGTYVTAFVGGGARVPWQIGLMSGTQDWASMRMVAFDGGLEGLYADTQADLFAGYGAVGLDLTRGAWQLRPQVLVRYVSVDADDYVEGGSSLLALGIADSQSETGYAQMNLSAARAFGSSVDLRLHAGIERMFPLDGREVDATFVNSMQPLQVELDADAAARNQLRLGSQINVRLGARAGLYLGYDLLHGEGDTQHAARLGLKLQL